ncbi:hypothetical protein KUV50_02465 [Membranicola marinus]|uniref:Uncharacterized protein n=1 Tax=Membranihabitans marinus TaxID=1227546 RepID=A0A953L5V5_9BACT|nr:hypothetical protein [Membranihabitans marinus]MBY5956982.1 hypothetical protein [Membranihabitans marinus]
MEYYDDENLEQNDHLLIDDEMKSYLDDYGRWGKILAIISFVGIGLAALMVLGGVGFLIMNQGDLGYSRFRISEGSILLFYFSFLLLYFLPALYLYRSSTSVQEAVRLNDDYALVNSFRNLKNLFKFMTILVIVGIGFYGLMIAGALIFGVYSFLGF